MATMYHNHSPIPVGQMWHVPLHTVLGDGIHRDISIISIMARLAIFLYIQKIKKHAFHFHTSHLYFRLLGPWGGCIDLVGIEARTAKLRLVFRQTMASSQLPYCICGHLSSSNRQCSQLTLIVSKDGHLTPVSKARKAIFHLYQVRVAFSLLI
jgi:hypothetical protein